MPTFSTEDYGWYQLRALTMPKDRAGGTARKTEAESKANLQGCSQESGV